MSVQSDDINDVFDRLGNEQPQEIASISNDSNLGSSLSNFGIDRDNPEENQRYIQQNQDPLAITQGIGVAARYPDGSENTESGLATSITKTVSGEFCPEVIEFEGENVSDTNSELNAPDEPQPGPSSGERYGYDPKYDESEKLAESLQELDISSFDLALKKGYRDQAKIYFDDATSKGLHPKTKHIKPLKEMATEEQLKEMSTEGSLALEDDFWTEGYTLQRVFNLIKDFEEYLENLENKKHKRVLEILNYKKKLNEKEHQIKKNIATKINRKNVRLQRETITIARDFLEKLKAIYGCVKDMKQKSKEDLANKMKDPSEDSDIFPSEHETGSKSHKENEKKDDNDFEKDGATGVHQSLT